MMPYQWTSAAIAIIIAATIVWLVRHNHMHARNAAWWVVVAVVVALIGSMPGFVDWVALGLGISYPPILAVLLGFGVVIFKLLGADIERSKQEQRIRILTQKVAVLETQLAPRSMEHSTGPSASESTRKSV